MENKFFKAEKLYNNVTAIAGMGGELCYLVEGKDRALLIDSLTGVGDLQAYVRELTDLPVTVVNTHGHVDHCGGNFDYGECYIHPDDIALMYDHADPARRLEFSKSGAKFMPLRTEPTLADVPKPRPIVTRPVYDGDIFDLGGGVQLEVIGVPGHSFGTIVLLDRAKRVVFSGDACNVNTLLFIGGSTTIERYKQSLLHFKTFQPYFDIMRGGHGLVEVPKVIIDEAIALCDEIMARTDDAVPSAYVGRACLYGKAKNERFQRLDGKLANIAYSEDNIFEPKETKARVLPEA